MPQPRFTLDKPTVCDEPVFLDALKRCGSVLASALDAARESVSPGVRAVELAELIERELVTLGATPTLKGYQVAGAPPFPAAAAISVNEVAVNGVPTDRPFEQGDVVTIDSVCALDGAVCDAAVSVVVGGGESELVLAARAALSAALGAIRSGVALAEISEAAQAEASRRGFELLNECVAHGTGLALHQPPAVFAGRVEPEGAQAEPGMILAVEPVVVERGAGRLRTMADGWSRVASGRSAYEERTVVVDEKGLIELTPLAFGGR